MDARNPRERLERISADAGLRLLLTGRDPRFTLPVLHLDVTQTYAVPPITVPASIKPADIAYLLYTSGTTGVPKGVAVPHAALYNLLCSMAERPGFGAADVLLAVTSLAFDIAQLELLLPLLTGGTVVIATEAETRDVSLLLGRLRTSRTTVMQGTPSLWTLLLEAGRLPLSPRLKVLSGGEALSREFASRLLAEAGEVWNMYGPTETTVWSSVQRVVPGTGLISIGQPIANTTMYVLDAARNPLPAGVSGELWIGGSGLAEGYWNRPELTAAAYQPNPFGEGRLYRSGDLARWREDGTLELLGRIDHQIKLRGHRIEIGAVEAALTAQPQVVEAAVLVKPAAEASAAALLAFVTLRHREESASEQIHTALQRQLPEYMLPARLIVVPAMPRLFNGKLDRRALLELANTETGAPVFADAETPEEEQLAAIWSEVLNQPRISVTSSIFELGADSLVMFRIAARCQRAGLPVRAVQILQHRTVRALARQLTAESLPVVPRSTIQPVAREKYSLRKEDARAER